MIEGITIASKSQRSITGLLRPSALRSRSTFTSTSTLTLLSMVFSILFQVVAELVVDLVVVSLLVLLSSLLSTLLSISLLMLFLLLSSCCRSCCRCRSRSWNRATERRAALALTLGLTLPLALQLSLEIGLRLQLVLLLVWSWLCRDSGHTSCCGLPMTGSCGWSIVGETENADLLSLRSSKRGGALQRRLFRLPALALLRMPARSECRHVFANNMHAFDPTLYLAMPNDRCGLCPVGRPSMPRGRFSMKRSGKSMKGQRHHPLAAANPRPRRRAGVVAARRRKHALRGAAADPRCRD